MYRIISIIIYTVLSINIAAVAGIEQEVVEKASDFKADVPDKYYIISKPITIVEDISIGTGCVLCFKPGGRLVGVPKSDGELPKLKLGDTGTGVRAWDMCIFENITISGNFTNSYIPAEWFDTEDMDDASNGCEIARCT